MPDEPTTPRAPNPIDLWRQWCEAAANPWLGAQSSDATRVADPFGLFAAFARGATPAQPAPDRSAIPDPVTFWIQWWNATLRAWTKATEQVDPSAVMKQWQQLAGGSQGAHSEPFSQALDPITAFRQWYEAISETWSQVAGNMVGGEAFVEMASRSLNAYASYVKSLRRASETRLSALQIPTRSDLARVASLVIALEEKVDRLDDALDERLARAVRSTQAGAVDTLASAAALEERLSRVERKLDALVTSLEQVLNSVQPAQPTELRRPTQQGAANGARRSAASNRRVGSAASARTDAPAPTRRAAAATRKSTSTAATARRPNEPTARAART